MAVNCCLAPVTTCAFEGDTATLIGIATVTVAVPDLDGSACDVAVTVTVAGFGTAEGAV